LNKDRKNILYKKNKSEKILENKKPHVLWGYNYFLAIILPVT